MTYNFDNINEFFEGLMNKPNAKFNMMCLYGAYERKREEDKKKQDIEDKYDWPGCHYEVYLISDDIAILEQKWHGKVKGYLAHVNNKKSNYIFPTFEMALLCAVSIKLTGCEDATEWMWKLVGGDRCV